MFVLVLLVTLLIALGVSAMVVNFFTKPVDDFLRKLVPDEIRAAWLKYITYAIYVIGVSGGVRITDIEKYLSPGNSLSFSAWVYEVYRTVIEALKDILWLLLLFFGIALIAYVVLRAIDSRREEAEPRR